MPATNWSNFWGDTVNSYNGTAGMISGKMPRRYNIKRTVNRDGFRTFTALFNGLIGATTGSNVTATHSQIAGSNFSSENNAVSNGGRRTIQTVTDINRNTTAADVTALKEMVFNVSTRPSYPRDLSGNGGGAFS